MSRLLNGKKKPYKTRYGMLYFKVGDSFAYAPDKWGHTNSLERAYAWCAFHIGASDVNENEPKRAAIFDKEIGGIIRTYSRTANGITIKDR